MKKGQYYKDINESEISFWDKRGPLLGDLDIELTERCNNDCIHCCINLPENDYNVKKKELLTEDIKSILKEAVSLGCINVRFTGGEPLLREDFEEIYVYARKLGLRVIIFTNATLINTHIARIFSKIPPLEKIEITIYGMKRSSYETITKNSGAFEAAYNGINLLLRYSIPFIVKSSILPANRNEMKDFEAWASLLPWMDGMVPSYSFFFDLRVRRDSEKKNRIIKGLRLSPEEGLKILRRNKDYVYNMKQFCSKYLGPPGKRLFRCGVGISGGNVDAYGFFYPCILLKHPDTAYKLKEGSLHDAITNFFPLIRKLEANNRDYIVRCAKCFLKSLCKQCPAESWLENGTLDTPCEYHCKIAHVQGRFLGLISQNELAWEVRDWEKRLSNFA